jgi:hypothetical protein
MNTAIVVIALAAFAAALHLAAVILHLRGSTKAELLVTDAAKVASDVEAAIPAGKMAVVAVILNDVEAEIEKVAPGSSIAAAFVRLRAVLKAAEVSK